MYISIMCDRTVKTEIRKLCEKTAAVSCCFHTFLINIRVNGDSAEIETIDHLRSCHLIRQTRILIIDVGCAGKPVNSSGNE